MAKDPAVLFYTSDFLSGVAFFTMEQRGQYITLLCDQHQHYSIPENHMINICGSLESPVIKKFIKDTDGTYYNERMRKEAIRRKSFCESRSNNKSGRKSNKSYDNNMIIHMENENVNEIKNNIKDMCKENSDIIFEAFERWRDYLIKQHDVVLKENEYTYQILESKIKEIGPSKIIAAIEHSIKSNYKKIYQPTEQAQPQPEKKKFDPKRVNDEWERPADGQMVVTLLNPSNPC